MDANKTSQPAAQTPVLPPADKTSTIKEIVSTLTILLSALTIAFGLLAFVFQSYQVDGPSMQESLHDQDRLVVWKAPRTWARITGNQFVPNRGDIIIFNENGLSAYGQDDAKQLVKRVIGLPGDRVVVRDGLVTVYNKEHPDGFQPDKTLPYGKEHPVSFTSGTNDVTLAENELFVCGDNRANSLDSRIFGPIHTDQVIGKLVARIYPFGDIEKF
jgi:signal peptidase I